MAIVTHNVQWRSSLLYWMLFRWRGALQRFYSFVVVFILFYYIFFLFCSVYSARFYICLCRIFYIWRSNFDGIMEFWIVIFTTDLLLGIVFGWNLCNTNWRILSLFSVFWFFFFNIILNIIIINFRAIIVSFCCCLFSFYFISLGSDNTISEHRSYIRTTYVRA